MFGAELVPYSRARPSVSALLRPFRPVLPRRGRCRARGAKYLTGRGVVYPVKYLLRDRAGHINV